MIQYSIYDIQHKGSKQLKKKCVESHIASLMIEIPVSTIGL